MSTNLILSDGFRQRFGQTCYFPRDAVKREYFTETQKHTTCPWKGLASYYTLDVNGQQNTDAAWFYPEPKDAAKQIKDYVAFWKGVKVSE